MNKLAWTLQILLALAFVVSGSMKLFTSRAEMVANPMMGWANDFSETQIKLIGVAEVAGGVGLVLPAATGLVPALTTVAAGALAALMVGAVATHVRRGEPYVPPLVLALLAMLVVYLRLSARAPAQRLERRTRG